MSKVDNIYIEKEDYYILRITSKKYGVFDFKINKEDYGKCKQYHWAVNRFNRKSQEDYFYGVNRLAGLLHRFIMDTPKGEVVDHKNGDTLDNRRDNLQICTYSNNLSKQKKKRTNTSGHRGIIWNDKIPTPKWMVYIGHLGKQRTIGYFDDLEDAIKARKEAELKYFKEFQPIQ